MAEMIGDRLLPDQVQSVRRQFRDSIGAVREPLRRAREDMVPGPDLVGLAENRFRPLRRRFMDRTSVLEIIRSQQNSISDELRLMEDMNGGVDGSLVEDTPLENRTAMADEEEDDEDDDDETPLMT